MNALCFSNQPEGRYDRHELISWWDQKRLATSRVLVAGAGALGNEALKLLALIGVGHITVIDFDVIAPSNLSRMVLFRQEDVGRSKVEVARERLRQLNPDIQVEVIHGDLRFDLGLGAYRRMNLVIGCLDSVNARWSLNRKCMLAGVDWIDGGISDHHGQIARYSSRGGACYECTFTAHTLERFNRRYSCPFGLLSEVGEDKTPTTALTSSVVAAIQVQQALLMLHGIEDEALQAGERLMIYLKPFRMFTDRLPENPTCLAHQHLPAHIPQVAATPEMTVAQVLHLAQGYDQRVISLALNEELVAAFHCPDCGVRQAVNRPKEKVFQSEATCPHCGSSRTPEIIAAISLQDPQANLPLQQIGVPQDEILTFHLPGDLFYLQLK